METEELLAIIANGEDSRHQFKQNITRTESLVSELAAFSNSKGGLLLIGVTDESSIQGLTIEDMGRINQLVSNAAKDVKPPISVTTENIALPSGMVMVVDVPEGISKPYMDGNLHVWVKNSANKSKLPNNLTVENIKMGNSNVRNPILVSFAPKVLPYRGLGSGIRRAIKAYPDIDFVDDRDGNTFKVIIKRAH